MFSLLQRDSEYCPLLCSHVVGFFLCIVLYSLYNIQDKLIVVSYVFQALLSIMLH